MSTLTKKTKLIVWVMLTIGTLSCSQEKWPGSDEIAITWEVVSNTLFDNARVVARFEIENNSQVTLKDNWELYFNQSPRHGLANDAGSLIQIERISGDWYRMYPLEGFILSPGQKVTVTYESGGWLIKESDAPMGLYFVFTGKDGDTTIVTAQNFTLLPFEREEQIVRHRGEYLPVPKPDVVYHANSKVSLIPPSELIPVIPSPFKISGTGRNVFWGSEPVIWYGEGLDFEAAYLQQFIQGLCNCNIAIRSGYSGSQGSIDLQIADVRVDGKNKEAYILNVAENNHILVQGSDKAGVFYGIQSLISLAGNVRDAGGGLAMPVMRIEDAPRFGYRGVHVDVARNFQTPETLKKVMDILAFYKINVMHVHLTEDEGWRIEIAAFPELTQVGGQREHTTKDAPALHPSYGSGAHPYAEGTYGSGFYTREEYVDLLRYATQRHITVIPEINMPGHSRAAIKAMEARYERLMKQGDEEGANAFRLIDPEDTSVYLSAQLYTDNVVNVARESAYRFFETVLDEIIDMYKEAGAPLEIVHVGGDEVPSGAWTASPMIDEKMKLLPHITRHANMHSYFTERALEIMAKKNLLMAGWEEVALMVDEDGAHIPNERFAGGKVIPYAWNNLWGAQDLAYRLANRGFPVVHCHVTNFYFDLAYSNDPLEPGLYWAGFVDTRNAWYYSPFNVFQTTTHDAMGRKVDQDTEYARMERLRPEARNRVLGVQAQLWSETILGPDMLEYYLLPKLLGFTESAWAKPRNWETTTQAALCDQQVEAGWNIFANTLGQRELHRLSYLFGGYNYRIPPPGAIIEDGLLKANVQFPGLIIRYTTDGSEPVITSPVYNGPVKVGSGKINIATFDGSGRRSRFVSVVAP